MLRYDWSKVKLSLRLVYTGTAQGSLGLFGKLHRIEATYTSPCKCWDLVKTLPTRLGQVGDETTCNIKAHLV